LVDLVAKLGIGDEEGDEQFEIEFSESQQKFM